MIKFRYGKSVIILGLIISTESCNSGDKAGTGSIEPEVLPEDIVELRADQIKLATIELGNVEMRSLSNILKVNGIVSVAPQSLATVCMPLGGFVKIQLFCLETALIRDRLLQ